MSKPWVGVSEVHHGILRTLQRLAPTDLEVLISGPSGVGKERYAQFVHTESGRMPEAFVAVNCGAIPSELVENELFGHVGGAFTGARADARGLVAAAEGGTLFLDEVDALSPRNQVVLLRFLQEKEYRRLGETRVRKADVRVVAATNCDIVAATRDGRFRQDLLYRLRVAPIEIPALHARPEDTEAIFAAYCEHYAAHYRRPTIRVGAEVRAAVRGYAWPGNVREVENCVRYLTCLDLGREVAVSDLPFAAAVSNGHHHVNGHTNGHVENGRVDFRSMKTAVVDELERTLVTQALEQANGNITHAARAIGKPRRTFFAMMRKHRITSGSR